MLQKPIFQLTVLAAALGTASCRTGSASQAKEELASSGQSAELSAPPALELGESYYGGSADAEKQWVDKLIAQSDITVSGLKDKTGKARRSAHSKTHGCLTAQVTMLPERPAESRVGVFAADGTYNAWVRFSNSQPAINADSFPDARGMALKIIVPNSDPKLLPGHEASNAVDFPFVSGPVFPAANVEEYLSLEQNLAAFLAGNLKAAGIFAKTAAGSALSSPLNGSYWSMGAFKLGDHAVKYKTFPCQGWRYSFALSTNRNYLRDSLIKNFMTEGKPGCFIFAVQLQKDPAKMPVEDPSVEWPESHTLFSDAKELVTGEDSVSPFQPVARIDIPVQTFTNEKIRDLEKRGSETSPQDDFCEKLSFNPWRNPAVQHPLGNLMRARRALYAASFAKRMDLNGTSALDDNLTGTPADVAGLTGAP